MQRSQRRSMRRCVLDALFCPSGSTNRYYRDAEKDRKRPPPRGACLLVAIRWRLGARNDSIMVGDLQTGYMIAPASVEVMDRLQRSSPIA